MNNTKSIISTETIISPRIKVSLLWILILISYLFHTQFELSELFVKTDITIEGMEDITPAFIHYFRILINFIPLMFAIGTLYINKKYFKIIVLSYSILLALLNVAHLSEELFTAEEIDLSQVILLSLVLFFNVLLVIESNKWRSSKKKVIA